MKPSTTRTTPVMLCVLRAQISGALRYACLRTTPTGASALLWTRYVARAAIFANAQEAATFIAQHGLDDVEVVKLVEQRAAAVAASADGIPAVVQTAAASQAITRRRRR